MAKRSMKRSVKRSVKRSAKKSVKRSGKSPVRSRKSGLKLVKITKSPNAGKKYRAYFSDNTHTDFGAVGYQNYGGVGSARHLDEERKRRYIQRHKARENWNNPKSAGSLSRWILWNKSTFSASVADYKRRFNL